MEYRCSKCNKEYSSYQSLWIHNKKFHNENVVNCGSNNTTPVVVCGTTNTNINKSYKCKFCLRNFNDRSNKCKHEKKCAQNKNIEIKILHDNLEKQKQDQELLLKIKDQEKELLLKEQEILKLKLKLERSKKADVVTLKQLNKLLLERKEEYQNYINNINNGTIYNGSNVQNIVNNIQLIGFGKEEDVVETLTNKEKKLIMDSRYKCLEKFIEIVHCGKYDKFKNIIVTNIKDNYMYRFDESKSQFVLASKDETIKCLIDIRMYDLETIYDELLEKNKLDDKTKDIIEKFINKLNDDKSKYTDEEGHIHETYKNYKINEIKLILYNNQDKIINDISLLLTTSETEEKEIIV